MEHHHELRFFVCLGISSRPQVAGARGVTLHCRVYMCLRAKLFPVLILFFPFVLWPVWQTLERCASSFSGSLPCSLWWLKLVPPASFLHMRCICKLLVVGLLCNCQLCSFAKLNCSHADLFRFRVSVQCSRFRRQALTSRHTCMCATRL